MPRTDILTDVSPWIEFRTVGGGIVIDTTDQHPASAERMLAWAITARAALTSPEAVYRLLADTDVTETADRLTRSPGLFALPADLGERAREDLDRGFAVGARLLTPQDPEWPARQLASLAAADVDGYPPVALWARGPLTLNWSTNFTVGIVGARTASDYGIHAAHDFALHFAEQGWRVLSGGAAGIDAAVHRAALTLSAPTIVVSPAGIDLAYPAADQHLFDRIADHGLIVSEYPPRFSPAIHHFVQRNRLVAALSAGLVVCAAGARSGSLNTAAWARQLHRPVAAVPGSIHSATAIGCHQLVRDGHADLAATAAEALGTIVGRTGLRAGR